MHQPNILIFMTDHQRADTVLPEHPALTPNLSRLAKEGLTFSEAYCPSPHCCPSRATFFTGLYPSRSGVWNNICNEQALTLGVKDGVRMWSENLAEAGYQLAFTGKWHVSVLERPKDRGWQELLVDSVAGDRHGYTWETYRKLAQESEPTQREPGQYLRPGYGAGRLYGAREEAFEHDERIFSQGLSTLADLAGSDQPWSLFIGLHAPHDPYFVPSKYLNQYDASRIQLPASYHDSLADKPRIYQRMRRQLWDQLSPEEVKQAIRHYWATCTYLDDLFGRLLSQLDDLGQADDTLVLYCSDHGDYCGEHGLFAKGIPCFEGAYHVPAVMRWRNGIVDPGRRVDAFVSLADFFPTFTELTGQPVPTDLSGQSLVPFLRGQTPIGWRDDIHTQCNGVELYYSQRSVKTREFKYVFNGFDEDELYDLRSDPYELRNLSFSPSYQKVKREMARRMWRIAYREQDTMINPYCTVALAPYGPAEAFRNDQ